MTEREKMRWGLWGAGAIAILGGGPVAVVLAGADSEAQALSAQAESQSAGLRAGRSTATEHAPASSSGQGLRPLYDATESVSLKVTPAAYRHRHGHAELDLDVELENQEDQEFETAFTTEVFSVQDELIDEIAADELLLQAQGRANRSGGSLSAKLGDGYYRATTTLAWGDGSVQVTTRDVHAVIEGGEIELVDVNDWYVRAGLLEREE